MKNTSYIIFIIVGIMIIICMFGYVMVKEYDWRNSPDFSYTEQPSLYYKDIDVEIISISKTSWCSGTHHYEVEVTVKSHEYNLVEDFTYTMRDAKELQSRKEGDILKARLYSWVMKSSGQVIRREINQLIF